MVFSRESVTFQLAGNWTQEAGRQHLDVISETVKYENRAANMENLTSVSGSKFIRSAGSRPSAAAVPPQHVLLEIKTFSIFRSSVTNFYLCFNWSRKKGL